MDNKERIKELQRAIAELQNELREQFLIKARSMCPYKIGTIIEYQQGKRGRVDSVGYSLDPFWNELDENLSVSWTVTGKKILRDGSDGKKNFQEVGPHSHVIEGTICRQKTVSDVLGISDEHGED